MVGLGPALRFRSRGPRPDRPSPMHLALLLVRNLLYPLLALLGSALGSLVLWLRRRKPTSFESSIDDFHKGLKALEPEACPQDGQSRLSSRPSAGRAP